MLNPDAVANQRLTGPRGDYIPPPPAYRRDGSVCTDDVRRAIQSGADSRDGIAKKLGVSRSAISKPLEYLRRTGEIIEAGEQITPAKSEARQKATKAVVPAQDARNVPEVSIPTTPPTECVTGEAKAVAEEVPYDATVADVEDALVAHDVARSAIAKLLTDNCRMRDWIDAHKDSYDLLLADRAELQKIKAILMELV